MNFNQILDKIKELKDEIEESRKLKKEEKNIFIKNINYNNIINEFENLKNLKDKKNIHNINLYEELKINKYLLCLNCYSTIIFEDFNHLFVFQVFSQLSSNFSSTKVFFISFK